MSALQRIPRCSLLRFNPTFGSILRHKVVLTRGSVQFVNHSSAVLQCVPTRFSTSQEFVEYSSKFQLLGCFSDNKSYRFYSTEVSADDCVIEELKGKLEANNVYLVDVRRPDELKESGYITGAVNIPLNELEASLQLSDDAFEHRFKRPKPNEDGTDLVFHCRSGVRSLTALSIARNLGYERSRHVPGGFLLWDEKYGH